MEALLKASDGGNAEDLIKVLVGEDPKCETSTSPTTMAKTSKLSRKELRKISSNMGTAGSSGDSNSEKDASVSDHDEEEADVIFECIGCSG
jgi:hypothetical protein